MAMASRFSKEVDVLVQELPKARRALVRRLRQLVLDAAPELTEKIKWGNPTYVGRSNVCCLMIYRDHVNLGFFKGTSVADPEKLLEGTGKGLRHVKIYEEADIHDGPLKSLIADAAALDAA